MVILFLKNRENILCKRKGEMTMRKWKLLLAGMMLMLSLSAVAGCGNNNANDKNNGTKVQRHFLLFHSRFSQFLYNFAGY